MRGSICFWLSPLGSALATYSVVRQRGLVLGRGQHRPCPVGKEKRYEELVHRHGQALLAVLVLLADVGKNQMFHRVRAERDVFSNVRQPKSRGHSQVVRYARLVVE